jgi:hypothetical protein
VSAIFALVFSLPFCVFWLPLGGLAYALLRFVVAASPRAIPPSAMPDITTR